MIEKLYTMQEVADILSLDIMTIYRYIKQKKLHAIKLGNHQYRISESKLQAFIGTPKEKTK